MSATPENEVIKRVAARIDAAIRRNNRLEWVIISMLVGLFVAGLVLIVLGFAFGRWDCTVPGGLAELAIILPINKLVQLRHFNVTLQIVPDLTRLADTDQAKRLIFDLITRLIEKV